MMATDFVPVVFPAEWHPQDGILLTWPHRGTDWGERLEEVETVYLSIARAVLKEERLVIACAHPEQLRGRFTPEEHKRIIVRAAASNDTWSRDHGPLCTYYGGIPVVNDFRFNGWGNKYDGSLDDLITGHLYRSGVFRRGVRYNPEPGLVLEGGSIESDGRGTLLTTTSCLLHPGRNPGYSREQIEKLLGRHLGAVRFLWLEHGTIEGDDTDGHIDTLVRFCDPETLCYVHCDRPHDIHADELRKMEACLRSFRTSDGNPYRLVPLPLPSPVLCEGRRLPATYANFLILNKSVLVPQYGQPEDREALDTLGSLFPGRRTAGIDCVPLIRQNGSLHCITMQIPVGFLRNEEGKTEE